MFRYKCVVFMSKTILGTNAHSKFNLLTGQLQPVLDKQSGFDFRIQIF